MTFYILLRNYRVINICNLYLSKSGRKHQNDTKVE